MLTRSRQFVNRARSRLELHDGLTPLRSRLLALSAHEIHMVAWAWRGTRRPGMRRTALCISWLGNGVLYVLVGLALLVTRADAVWPVAVAALCIAASHLVYPWAKLACSRSRPFHYQDDLQPLLACLDHGSFPSGHAMTLTAAMVPILAVWPGAWPAAVAAWLAMAWSRVACAHHYPSDVVAGSALGLIIALPITLACW